MASDYASIRSTNERRYGTDIGRIGPLLLADRYDDRTHFIFELLQNAEDALSNRSGWRGSRTVSFKLADGALRFSHYGKPFDESNVEGICGIGQSTKDLTEIGHFGIGFKSVYAFTNRPEVHSGDEDFAIENFVWPITAPPLQHEDDETVIILPLIEGTDRMEIAQGLHRLGARTLLFLRQIKGIEWQVQDDSSGIYLRGSPETLSDGVRRITVIGQEEGKQEIEETWLVFSRELRAQGTMKRYVEIAFSIARRETSADNSIEPVTESHLIVFFPTILETHLGFLVQGPYRTTPSRDNVPRNETWNQHLVSETAALLVEALRWLRDQGMLDTAALGCLPLDRARFGDTNMFAPLFEVTREALLSEPLLPRNDGGHVVASNTRLARTQDLRDLFNASQLGAILGKNGELAWLRRDITQDRTPALRDYLMHELEIDEITPDGIIPNLSKSFLETQSDEWILRLYEFLRGQSALLHQGRLSDIPLVRLHDGAQVRPQINGQPQAFLPSAVETGFPTVRRAVCVTDEARKFLESLGLTEPDAVDDVIRNVLPRYRANEVYVGDADYEADLRRILAAFETDSKEQREKLLAALRETAFVMAIAAGDGSKRMSRPGNVYLATDRLKTLFAGIPDVLLVDNTYSCLRGEDVRVLLEASGALRHLRPVEDSSLSWEERSRLREQGGHAETSGRNDRVTDWTLHGLEGLLKTLPNDEIEKSKERSMLLWEELAYLEERRGKGVFAGEYTWTHNGSYRTTFDAAFIRKLKATRWVTDGSGELQQPELILFDTLGWKPNPFLQSKILFKPPVIDQLAKEAGIEPGVLDLLKQLGVTSEVELRSRLGLEQQSETSAPGEVNDALNNLLGETFAPTPPVSGLSDAEPAGSGGSVRTSGGTGSGTGGDTRINRTADGYAGTRSASAGGGQKRAPGSPGGRPFISYVGIHLDDGGLDPDGLDQQVRMTLEEKAITLILTVEPNLRRTSTHNPGFDLFEPSPEGEPIRWIEVKAMTGSLHDRPVGLSRTQFECAQEHSEGYWIYVVEHAGTENARIVRIQNPAGKARTFTFDHGWLQVATKGPQTLDSDGEDE